MSEKVPYNREGFESLINKAHEEALKDNTMFDEHEAVLEESKSISEEGGKNEITFEEAERLFGKNFFGPSMIERTFGNSPDAVPNIPFSKAGLERANRLGQQLILQNDFMNVENPDTGEMERDVPITLENLRKYFPKTHDDMPMFYNNSWPNDKEFFKNEKPRIGWRLTSRDVISGTKLNYVDQTDVLVDYLQNRIFKGAALPKKYEDAIVEWKRERANIESLPTFPTDWKHLSELLADLTITKLTRELPVEVAYRLILNDRINKDRLLSSTRTWTASIDSKGGLVAIGDSDYSGISIYGIRPDHMHDTSASFSRS